MRKDKSKIITSVALTAFLSMSSTGIAYAQMPGAPGGPGAAGGPAPGPIDITANEQEFAGDSVIAKGNVRVVYKDSVILAPLATLYKDPSGNPNRAVFTGHPRLTQGHSKIDANTLVFEMAVNKIVATGNAHSEVDIPEDEDATILPPANGTKVAGAGSPTSPASPTKTSSTTVKADPDSEDDSDGTAVTPAAVVAESPNSKGDKKGEKKPSKPPEKIITDSEKQEYDSLTGRFDAFGHVKVVNGDITVFADKLQLVYGALNNKPETAIFTGHVIANQGKNTTFADNMNYSLSTKRLQATGNVKSKVIQEKAAPPPPKKNKEDPEDPSAMLNSVLTPAVASNKKAVAGGARSTSIVSPMANDDNKPFWVYSDAQDYSKDNGRLSAHGNCRVVSGEMYGCGPSIVLVKKADGRADKVYFKGRSQISQPGRRWIADEITYVVDDKLVVANGHARAMILGDPNGDQAPKRKVIPDVTPTRVDAPPERWASPKQPEKISANKNRGTQ